MTGSLLLLLLLLLFVSPAPMAFPGCVVFCNVCVPSAMSGYENLACELIGQKCTAYQECAPDSLGSYSCTEKATMAQLAAFFSEGGSSDTPFWIWITVGVGAIFLILLLWGLIRKSLLLVLLVSPEAVCLRNVDFFLRQRPSRWVREAQLHSLISLWRGQHRPAFCQGS